MNKEMSLEQALEKLEKNAEKIKDKDIGIDESLEIVVAMVVNLGRVEDVFHAAKGLQALTARLVVHHTDASVGKLVKTVDAPTNF